jgi:hypothetical protein
MGSHSDTSQAGSGALSPAARIAPLRRPQWTGSRRQREALAPGGRRRGAATSRKLLHSGGRPAKMAGISSYCA